MKEAKPDPLCAARLVASKVDDQKWTMFTKLQQSLPLLDFDPEEILCRS